MQQGQVVVTKVSLQATITGILETKPVILQFLKFAGIGFLTTAVDFLVLNLISKFLGVNSGYQLGLVNGLSFIIALAHSYLWNGNWTFGGGDGITAFKSFVRIALVGIVGVVGIGLAVLGGKTQAAPTYYLIILLVFAVVEVVIWKSFSLGWFKNSQNTTAHTVAAFVIVSLVGTLINSGLISLVTSHWPLTMNADLNKNLAKVIATAVSLVWNFVGYKLLVFRR